MLPPLRIAVTSAVRHAGTADISGYFRLVELEDGHVTLKAPIPESSRRADDPNPRGGVRGAKGMSSHGNRFVVANSERLFVFDQAWSLVAELSHPLMGAVHDVLVDEDGIWVTCSGCDLLLKLDWDGNPVETWSWRSEPGLVSALGFDSLPAFDPELDHRDPRIAQQGVHNVVHLNALARSADGLLLLFGRILSPAVVERRLRKAAIARTLARVGISRPLPTKATPVPASSIPGSSFAVVELPGAGTPRVLMHRSGITVPNHNVAELGDGVVYLDSNDGRLVVADRHGVARAAVPRRVHREHDRRGNGEDSGRRGGRASARETHEWSRWGTSRPNPCTASRSSRSRSPPRRPPRGSSRTPPRSRTRSDEDRLRRARLGDACLPPAGGEAARRRGDRRRL